MGGVAGRTWSATSGRYVASCCRRALQLPAVAWRRAPQLLAGGWGLAAPGATACSIGGTGPIDGVGGNAVS